MQACSDKQPKPVAKWVDAGNGWIPSSALVGGHDVSGENLYIGRSSHLDHLIVGKVNQSHGVCYIGFEDKELAKNNYQVLSKIDNTDVEFEWVEGSHGQVPKNAIQGGVNKNKEPYYVGRVIHDRNSSLVIGNISPKQRALIIPFAGRSFVYQQYECLCIKQKQ